jgi:hypothetical protein
MPSNELTVLKGRFGAGTRLAKGQSIEIVNTHGHQIVDFWALNASDLKEAASMPHSRNNWYRMIPRKGDQLITNRRNPIMTMTEDTSPGVHDTLIPCCDHARNRQLGLRDDHRSCGGNFIEAMTALGLPVPDPMPMPLNLFMNVPALANGALGIAWPVSKPGDMVVLRADMDVIVVMSACPHDLYHFNGPDCTPKDVAWRIV